MATDPRRRPPPPPPPPPPPEETQVEARRETSVSSADAANQQATSRPQSTQPGGTNGEQTEQTRPGSESNSHNDSSGGGGGFKLKFCTVCASNNNRSMEAHLRLTTAPSPYPTISFGTGSLVRLPGPSISQPNVYSFNSTSYRAMHDELAAKDARLYRANGILPMLERNKGVKWGPERWQDWRVGVPRVGKRWHGSGNNNNNNGIGGADELLEDDNLAADYAADRGAAGTEAGSVDIVITCEERCWDAVVDDLLSRGAPLNRPVHVFNVDIKDNHEEALVGGRAILELADALNAAACEERDAWAGGGGGGGGGALQSFDAGHAGARAGFDERVPRILALWQDRWPQLPALWTLAWF